MGTDLFYLAKDVGFPMVVAILLIYDKLKTQDRLIRVIENNNSLLAVIKLYLARLAKQ